jgi:hypothetical protein
MKKIKFILAMVCIAGITSCEDFENKVFDSVGGKTLASFGSSTYNLEIEINATGATDIQVNVTTVSNEDRTFNISLDAANSTAIAGSYNLPTSVTIPAGEYTGILPLTGTDVAGVDTTPETLTLNIVDGEGYTVGPATIVSVYQICPVPDTYFVGNYSVTDTAAIFGGANFASASTAVSVGASATQRRFTTTYLGTSQQVVLNLVCDQLIFASTIAPGFTCGGGAITVLPSRNNTSTYSIAGGDTIFFVDYHVTATCLGANGRAAAFAMVKI